MVIISIVVLVYAENKHTYSVYVYTHPVLMYGLSSPYLSRDKFDHHVNILVSRGSLMLSMCCSFSVYNDIFS